MFKDNLRLYDIFIRHQTYLEGVKAGISNSFNVVQLELTEEITRLIRGTKYESMDGLTKVELYRLLVRLREVQSKIYSVHTQKMIDLLIAFSTADLDVVNQMIVSEEEPQGYQESDDKSQFAALYMQDRAKPGSLFGAAAMATGVSVWATARNLAIPANGSTIDAFLKAFSLSARSSVENTVTKGWSNRWTKDETLNAIISEVTLLGTKGALHKIGTQNKSVVDTIVQHVSSVVTAGLQSMLYDYYIWLSIMDNRTTEICISRNRSIYRYGEGPIPPAHIRCRSGISPMRGKRDDINEESFFTWMKRQPFEYQTDVLGKSQADLLKAGKIKATDLSKFVNRDTLTPEQFTDKLGFILLTNNEV